MDLWDEITAQRLALADLLDGLDDAQWRTPSLCTGWTVQAVVAHLAPGPGGAMLEFLPLLVKARGRFGRANDLAVQRAAERPRHKLVADLRTYAEDRFAPPLMGPRAPLTDVLVHGRDIGRPLGLAVVFDPQSVRAVLDFVVTKKAARAFVRKGRVDGLRFEATDLNWAYGDGPVVRGTAEAVMLAIVGRTVALDDVTGEGVTLLGERP
jgi:uncharacterized protein (TIGR03083 family)